MDASDSDSDVWLFMCANIFVKPSVERALVFACVCVLF